MRLGLGGAKFPIFLGWAAGLLFSFAPAPIAAESAAGEEGQSTAISAQSGHIDEIRALIQADRLGEALAKAQRELATQPDDPDALYALSLALYAHQDHAQALELMAATLPAQSSPDWDIYGDLLLISGQYAEAFDALTRALAIEKSGHLYSLRGRAAAYQGEAQQAHDDFRQALKFGKNAERHHDLASIYLRIGWQRRALFHLNRALKADPHYVPALDERGLIFHRMHRYERAREDLDLSLALNSGNYLALTLRADLRFELQDFNGAISDASRAIALAPRYAQAYAIRGQALGKLGLVEESEADLLTYDILKNTK